MPRERGWRYAEFSVTPVTELDLPAETANGPYMRLSPLRHGTDGFFAAVLER